MGFDLVGIARAGPIGDPGYYAQWLAAGYHGTMDYLRRSGDARHDPRRLLPGARSVICTAVSYHRPSNPSPAPIHGVGSPEPPRSAGRIAQYARGVDYHRVLRRMLEALDARMRQSLRGEFESRVYVDTGPLLERQLAAAAGLGWIGKNTLLLHARLGSFLVLGELLSTLELEPDQPVADHCGSCTRCLDACPPRAFLAPYRMDASRCVSYLTIEHRGPIPDELRPAVDDWIYGCDVCQDVCPFNAHAPAGTHPDLTRERLPERIELSQVLGLSAARHRRFIAGTAGTRATRSMWRRNAGIVAGNSAAKGRRGAGGAGPIESGGADARK